MGSELRLVTGKEPWAFDLVTGPGDGCLVGHVEVQPPKTWRGTVRARTFAVRMVPLLFNAGGGMSCRVEEAAEVLRRLGIDPAPVVDSAWGLGWQVGRADAEQPRLLAEEG